MRIYQIAAIVGSLREDSFNRKTAENLIRLAPENIDMHIVEIGDLPHYNEDLDKDNPPKEWMSFRSAIKEVDGVFFFTPEYNRSVSGVIKNAIDVGSRPYGKSVWAGKPAAVASVSVGSMGAYLANHTLRQSLVCLNMPVMQTPEIYLSNASSLFDDQGQVVNASKDFFQQVIDAYAKWVTICLD